MLESLLKTALKQWSTVLDNLTTETRYLNVTAGTSLGHLEADVVDIMFDRGHVCPLQLAIRHVRDL